MFYVENQEIAAGKRLDLLHGQNDLLWISRRLVDEYGGRLLGAVHEVRALSAGSSNERRFVRFDGARKDIAKRRFAGAGLPDENNAAVRVRIGIPLPRRYDGNPAHRA